MEEKAKLGVHDHRLGELPALRLARGIGEDHDWRFKALGAVDGHDADAARAGKLAGDGVTRVPIDQVEAIKSFVQLKATANELGLHKTENRARRWIPKRGAL